jgi:hypothetical protein
MAEALQVAQERYRRCRTNGRQTSRIAGRHKENVVIGPDSRSSEKFLHGIKVLMAKNYVENLGEELAPRKTWFPTTSPPIFINLRSRQTASEYKISPERFSLWPCQLPHTVVSAV